jgi:hypothetical protein
VNRAVVDDDYDLVGVETVNVDAGAVVARIVAPALLVTLIVKAEHLGEPLLVLAKLIAHPMGHGH